MKYKNTPEWFCEVYERLTELSEDEKVRETLALMAKVNATPKKINRYKDDSTLYIKIEGGSSLRFLGKVMDVNYETLRVRKNKLFGDKKKGKK